MDRDRTRKNRINSFCLSINFIMLIHQLMSTSKPGQTTPKGNSASVSFIYNCVVKSEQVINPFSAGSHSLWLGGCRGQSLLLGRDYLHAEMEAEVLDYQMSPKSRRESERFKSYSHAKLQLWFATFRSTFTDPTALNALAWIFAFSMYICFGWFCGCFWNKKSRVLIKIKTA